MIAFPYNLIGIALLMMASALGGAKVQSWHTDSLEKARVEQQIQTDKIAHAEELARYQKAIDAVNAAKAREQSARADAESARAALVGLSHASEQAIRFAQSSHEACIVTATATTELLEVCSSRYTGLAEKADRHVGDVQTLMQAYPE